MYCTKCGKRLENNSAFCSSCCVEVKEVSEYKRKLEVKKIDTLLKVGVILVVLSGIIFATTSWDIMSNSVKTILLVLFGGIFLELSKFSETKLKLEKTTFTYWLISMMFFIISFFSIGSFAVFGKWFSLQGEGINLFYGILSIIIATISYITYRKFRYVLFQYISHFSLFSFLIFFLVFLNFSSEMLVLLLVLILIFLNILNKFVLNESKVVKTTIILFNFILVILVLPAVFETSKFNVIAFSDMLLIPLNLFLHIYFYQDNSDMSSFASVFKSIMVFFAFSYMIRELEGIVILLTIAFSLLYLLTNIFKITKLPNNYLDTEKVTFIISLLILLFIDTGNNFPKLFVAVSLFLINMINICFEEGKRLQFDKKVLPLSITVLFFSIFNFINISFELGLIIVVSFLLLFEKVVIVEEKTKRAFSIFSLIALALSIMISYDTNNILYPALNFFLSIVYLAFSLSKNDTNESFTKVIPTILFSVSSISLLCVNNLFNIEYSIAYLIQTIIFILLTFVKEKARQTNILFDIFASLCLISFIDDSTLNYTLSSIIFNIIGFVILINFIRKLTENRKTLFSIGSLILLALVLFEEGVAFSIYSIVVSMILIIIGYMDKSNKKIFLSGVIALFANIVYRLKYLWFAIPFWAYLLIIGIGLIGFVTYKQVKKLDSIDETK